MAQEIAIFTKIQGDIYSQEDSVKTAYELGDSVENNTTVFSGQNSYALLHYKFNQGSLRVFPNSAVNIISLDSLSTQVRLTSGKILNDLKGKIKGTYTVETTSTVASVRGTAFEVILTDVGTDVNVVEGQVDVLNKISGKTHSLGANQRLISRNDGELIELTPEGKPILDEEDNQPQEDGEDSRTGSTSDGNSNQAGGNNLNPSSLALPTISPSISPSVPTPGALPTIDKNNNDDERKDAEDKAKNQAEPEANSEAFPIAIVLKVKGELNLIRNNKNLACPVGTMLENNDILRTDSNSLALIKLVDNSSKLRLFSNSELVIKAEQDNNALDKNLDLEAGSILSTVNNKIAGKYSVSTTSTIASVRGTEFLVELKDGITKVTGFSGRVEVENRKSKEKVLVTKGNTASSSEDGQIDRQATEEVPAEVNEELETLEYENTMRIHFENEEGSKKTIILEY